MQENKTTVIYIAKTAIWNLQKDIFKQNLGVQKTQMHKVNTEHISHSLRLWFQSLETNINVG